jgi:hypothetical protein
MKTDRLTLLVTPDEKAEMTARADAMGISASELARRAIRSYIPEFDTDGVQTLADELATVVEKTEKKVDAALAQLRAFEAFFADPEARGAEARAALEREGLEWPFAVPARSKPRRKSAPKTTGAATL